MVSFTGHIAVGVLNLELKIHVDKRSVVCRRWKQHLPVSVYACNDTKSVAQLLERLRPKGENRQKVVLLCDEMKKLNLNYNPVAFCFLLRSVFELSAKAYCQDHNIKFIKLSGKEKPLIDILKMIIDHMTISATNQSKMKILHGSFTELRRKDGLLSITSLNQLAHNPYFSIGVSDICIRFGNLFPLLEAMN
jgi:hypothetical protein